MSRKRRQIDPYVAVLVTVPSSERARWLAAASRDGVSLADWVRLSLAEAASTGDPR